MEAKKMCDTPEWRAAFRQQITPQTMQAAVRCAEIEIARLNKLEIPIAWDAEDLVQKTITATCEGRLAWDPEVVGLRAHLRDKIRLACRRLRRRKRRAMEVMAVELDAAGEQDAVWNDPALTAPDTSASVDTTNLARRVESELWRLAAADQAVLRVIAAMAEGETTLGELVIASGLGPRAVLNAKARLQRLALQLPPELLADVRDELSLNASIDGSCDDGMLDRSEDGLE
ncbi:MAG: hypothetical protein K8M05_38530 [Deltaproteobacteria bacterium]|nr:hypothetical protein [Kofleriaceae bacterium]